MKVIYEAIPEPSRISPTRNFEGLKLHTRNQLRLTHLADHKFIHNFVNSLNPHCKLFSGDLKKKNISFLIVSITIAQCKHFWTKNNLNYSNILQQNNLSITKDLLFCSKKLKDDKNNALLTSMIEFIQSMEIFK